MPPPHRPASSVLREPIHRLALWLSALRLRRAATAIVRREEERWEWGYAVLRGWHNGEHVFKAFSPHRRRALAAARRDRDSWFRAPTPSRPVLWSLVEISRADMRAHNESTPRSPVSCASPDCRYTREIIAYAQERDRQRKLDLQRGISP